MIKFINSTTNTDMWVADNRKDEYIAAGHKLAAVAPKEPEEKPTEPKKRVKKK